MRSRTISLPQFSIQTQVCLLSISFFLPGLRINVRVAPHIGHLYTLVTADIFARYNRLANPNRPVHFVTGTDEHGLKIQRAAHGASCDPQIFCNSLSAEFRVCLHYVVELLQNSQLGEQKLVKEANVSATRFIRTTEQGHHHAAQHVWVRANA